MAITVTLPTPPLPPMTHERIVKCCATAALLMLVAVPAFAQDQQSLAKEAKNPFTKLVNLQFFYDAGLAVGPDKETQSVLTIRRWSQST
jgi:hypothetical protein